MAYKLADGTLSTDYEVGDEFVVVSRALWSGACIGDVVKLSTDDKSSCPLFTNVTQGVPCCPYWKNLKRHTKQFTKSDLKDGMRIYVEGREGYFVVAGKRGIQNTGDGFEGHYRVRIENITDDFSETEYGRKIMRVTDRDGTILFERKPETKKVTLDLTDDQIEKLKTQLGIEV